MGKINEFIEYMRNLQREQIIEIIVAIVVATMFLALGSFLAYGVLRIFYKKENREQVRDSKLYKHIRDFIYISGFYIASRILSLTIEHDAFIAKLYRIAIIWTIANVICGVFEIQDVLSEKFDLQKKYHRKSNKFMTVIAKDLTRILAYIAATYLTLKEFNYDLGGLVTGLGIVGAVVALAAQDVVKQLIAGVAIVSDKPFEMGDWIEANGVEGKVEEISWRSTKIRNMEDLVITIDNNVLLASNVVNWGKIRKRVFKTYIRLPLETKEEDVEKVINRIRFILKYNNDVIKDSISVQLVTIEEDALSIEVYLDTTITALNDYKAFKNKLNLTILNILETQGIDLSYPGQNIYIKNFEGNTAKLPMRISGESLKENTKAKPIRINESKNNKKKNIKE